MMRFSIAWIFALLMVPTVHAAELNGVKMPDEITVTDRTLVLNGQGIRTADFLPLKVYVAGLYLEQKSKDADSILKSTMLKRLDLEFVRSVGAGRIRDAWEKGVHKNCTNNCAEMEAAVKTLNAYMQDMATADKMSFLFRPEGVEVTIKGEVKGSVAGSDFSKTLLSVFIGAKPPNKDLRSGLLGL